MDHVVRVIHELDATGKVLRIGWELAGSVIEREKAYGQVLNIIDKTSAMVNLLNTLESPLIKQTREYAEWVEALSDLRLYVQVLKQGCEHGRNLPAWETAPTSNRYQGFQRRAG